MTELAGATELSREDHRWMARALELAAQAEVNGEVPVGAVVVANGVELGAGFNAPISCCDPTAHAEVRALRAACAQAKNYRLSGATLYVTLEPCTMCAGALVHARISRLVFGTREPKAGAVVSCNALLEHESMNWQVAVTEGVMAEPCQRLISGFFAQRRAQRKAQRQADKTPLRGMMQDITGR